MILERNYTMNNDKLETLSKENKHYCAIKMVVDMRNDLSPFVEEKQLELVLILMVQRLVDDLELTARDRIFLLVMVGITDFADLEETK
jgi:hypothetical protein